MLSGMSADEIVAAIRSNDLGRLTAIPGVGRKTAERLVIELRDKVGELAVAAGVAAAISADELPADAVFDDALSALVNLGYQKSAAERPLKKVWRDGTRLLFQKRCGGVCRFWRNRPRLMFPRYDQNRFRMTVIWLRTSYRSVCGHARHITISIPDVRHFRSN